MIEVALPIYDEFGIQVDTTTVNLTQEQVDDIVNAAARVIYADRLHDDGDEVSLGDLQFALAELDEALTSYSVIEDPEDEEFSENNS